jgi:hypothetical protein
MFHEPVLCCIAKNEEPYIIEWIIYHLKIGFCKIFIYDNNDDNTKLLNCLKKIENYPEIRKNIVIIPFPGEIKQIAAYNHFLKNFSKKWKWVSIMDCDEFIVIKDPNYIPIKKLLIKYCNEGSLGIHWKLFGNNNKDTYEDEPVTSRFIKCEKLLNPHIKSISVCKDIKFFNNPHYPILYNNKNHKDYLGRIINGPLQYIGLEDNMIYINHYFCKTIEEWIIKRDRGRASCNVKRNDSEYHSHNKNEIDDMLACDFYKSIILPFS